MAGEMKKPTAFQKLIHQVVMLRPVTAFFAPRTHRLDQAVLKIDKRKIYGFANPWLADRSMSQRLAQSQISRAQCH